MIYISTNMYKPETVMQVQKITDKFNKNEVGIELFIFNNSDGFNQAVNANLELLNEYDLTFHGPYLKTEHSAPKGTESYEKTMELYKHHLGFVDALKPKYIVYHTNNKVVDDKDSMIEHAFINLDELETLNNTPLVIENAGVGKNNLFTEEEFINIFNNRSEDALIDIGHAKANGWDLENVINSLADRIVSYHIHTNDGIHDQHLAVSEDLDELKEFLDLFKKYTPAADIVLEYNGTYEGQEDLVVEDVSKIIKYLK